MHQSIPAAPRHPPPPRPRADPPALTFLFFALDGKFPGLGTLELSNLTGWGRSRLTSVTDIKIESSKAYLLKLEKNLS